MSKTLEAAKNTVGVLITGLAVFALAIYVESGQILEAIVVPLPGTPVPVWISEFRVAASATIWTTALFIAFWYVPAGFMYSMNSWSDARGKRVHWWVAGGLAIITAVVVGFFMTRQTRSGGEMGYVFFALNSGLFYYLSTALFSPYSFKYIALGARLIRPRWL